MQVSFFPEGEPAGVLTTEPLGKTLDYLAPSGGCALGAFVEVPLGPRRVLGVVKDKDVVYSLFEGMRRGTNNTHEGV